MGTSEQAQADGPGRAPAGTPRGMPRLDTGAAVGISYRPGGLVEPGRILMSGLGPGATEASRRTFPYRWQEMVRTILEHPAEVLEIVPA